MLYLTKDGSLVNLDEISFIKESPLPGSNEAHYRIHFSENITLLICQDDYKNIANLAELDVKHFIRKATPVAKEIKPKKKVAKKKKNRK